jgi:hypothetical protein
MEPPGIVDRATRPAPAGEDEPPIDTTA